MRFITSLQQPTLKQNSFFGHRRFAMITKPAIQLLIVGVKLFPSSEHAPAGPCDCNLLQINIFITTF